MKFKFLLLIYIFSSATIYAQNVNNELNKFAGVFAGEWTTFILNENKDVVKSRSWNDTLSTINTVINDTIAFVDIKSVMIFQNPNIPAYKMDFREGFKIENGKITSHFFSVMGVESKEIKVKENTYIISQEVSPFELKQLGINKAEKGTNTSVKIIEQVNGIEVHKITRISTILVNENGEDKIYQFVSMTGYHKKLSE